MSLAPLLIIILLVSVMDVHWPCSQNLQCIYIEMITESDASSFLSLLSSQSVIHPSSQSVIQTVISQSASQLVGQSASHFDFKAKKSNANKKNNFTLVQRAESLSKLIPRKLELKDQWASFTGQLAMRAS